MADLTFVVLSFEGPDQYASAGGLATRVTQLTRSLAGMGFETHLFFIGAPDLPGHEVLENGKLHLHRWCQWISRYHPGGVYDGEIPKLSDWDRSLVPWLQGELLAPKVASGGMVIVLAEEWQTAQSVMALHRVVAGQGWQQHVRMFWNANNTYSFNRIDWGRLKQAATITTVSRYMKHVMWDYGVDAHVVPNGIPDKWLLPVERRASLNLARVFRERLSLVKIARWDPAKRWDMAVDALAGLKRLGLRPLLLARRGQEHHSHEVLRRAESHGLRVAHAQLGGSDVEALVEALAPAVNADMVILDGYLTEEQRRVLFHVADAVLANSGVEPFGLVGLETMAVGGIALVGCTGEDYVTPGHDAISVQSSDPHEIVYHVANLHSGKTDSRKIRLAARRSAARYTWTAVIRRTLLPFLEEQGIAVNDGLSSGLGMLAALVPPHRQPVVAGNADAATRECVYA